ncbi:hypothetical protein EF405_03920 [Cyclobacteriaceae bacterium YHN15]|nr:hypothetical protein EF405_03920 [Cyclobacteriaceae bacterium YHN15]
MENQTIKPLFIKLAQFLIVLFFLFSIQIFTINTFAQGRAGSLPGTKQSKPKENIYLFLPNNEKAIDLTNRQDGTHQFSGTDGNRMIIEIKGKQITNISYLTKSGKKVNTQVENGSHYQRSINDIQETILGSTSCKSCTIIIFPDGGVSEICSTISCPDADSLNEAVNDQSRRSRSYLKVRRLYPILN